MSKYDTNFLTTEATGLTQYWMNGSVYNGNTHKKGSKVMQDERILLVHQVKEKAQKMKLEFMEQFEEQLSSSLDDFISEVEQLGDRQMLNGTAVFNRGNGATVKPKERRKEGELSDKEFQPRRSVLTELLEVSHIRTIYHIFVAILIVFSMNTILYDCINEGRLALDFQLIQWSFGRFPVVMSLWFCMNIATVVLVYPLFNYWAYNRIPGPKANWMDYVWLALLVIYQLAFLILPAKTIIEHRLPPASSFIIVCEQVRLMMKCHAFVRENIPKAVKYDKDGDRDDNKDIPCPDFSKYLYFLFVPTLVYRDHYPRTTHIRWNYVVSNFLQVFACLFYLYYIFERFCEPVFRNFTKESVTPKSLILSAFGSMMPATLVLFIGFFAILHSWMNAFAEMLKFADRLFYKDWWNSTSFSTYYRTWNVIVHDWLYSYVYRDVYKLMPTPNRAAAMASVFLLSAVFHEYVLTLAFGFFYPVLFIMFAGAGFGFIFLPSKGAPRSGNVFMWVALFLGNGILMCLYSLEWYARKSCPPTDDFLWDNLIPRSFSCDFSSLQAIDV